MRLGEGLEVPCRYLGGEERAVTLSTCSLIIRKYNKKVVIMNSA